MRVASQQNLGRWMLFVALAVFSVTFAVPAQAQARSAAGTVKTVSAGQLTVTTTAGTDLTVAVPDGTKVLEVAPGSHDLKSATPAQMSDVSVGDRVLVTGAADAAGTTITAQRVILMKSAAIADSHAQEDAAWAAGGGGIVKSVDAARGTIVVSHGLKLMTVTTTASTQVKRYSPDSIQAQDAVLSTVAAIHPGDQLRVRGTKSEDGNSIVADAILTGSFKNYSGLLTAIDGTAGTITLKDLATKKVVVVAVTDKSDVRRIPLRMATMIAMRMHGGGAAGAQGGAGAHAAPAPGADAAGGGEESDRARAGRAGMDLSQMLERLPTETLAGLTNGEAVMIVATSPNDASGKATAVTLLVGVEPILQASPSGETMTLSPWSVGGEAPTDAGGGGGGGAR